MLEDRNNAIIDISKARIKITFSLVRWASVPEGRCSPFKGPYDPVLCRFFNFRSICFHQYHGKAALKNDVGNLR